MYKLRNKNKNILPSKHKRSLPDDAIDVSVNKMKNFDLL